MKQKLTQLLFVLSFICFGQLLVAQDFGIRAGVNYADISGIEEFSDAMIGFQFGPVAEFDFSDAIGLNVAALFSMKGSQDGRFVFVSKFKMNYVDLPLLLHYDFGGFYAELGPQFSILLNADIDGFDSKDLLKSTDLAAIIGVGYDLGSIRIDARYAFGLSNIDDEKEEQGLKNKVVTLGVSYMFGSGGS